jgi:hypothetical protein
LAIGALILSMYTALFLAPQALGALSTVGSFLDLDLNHVVLLTLVLLSLVSVIWFDVVFTIDARGLKQIPEAADYRFPRSGDWVVWLVAVCLSVWMASISVESLSLYRRLDKVDILLTSLPFALAVIAFDVAVVVQAFKMRRVQRMNRPATRT